MWRKTRVPNDNGCFGVDPNRNWNYQWMNGGASDNPCDSTYAGKSSFSEIETRERSRITFRRSPANCLPSSRSTVTANICCFPTATLIRNTSTITTNYICSWQKEHRHIGQAVRHQVRHWQHT